MAEDENFLNHTFHDSYLKGIERQDNKTTLVIDTDIYWYPGKPFTLLTLVNPENITRVKELVGGSKHSSMSIDRATVTRSDKSEKNFNLNMSFHSGEDLELHFYNFWTERVEEYGDYTNTTFR
jgi:hypothetical protein